MADSPIRYIDDDASIYAAEIVPPEGDEHGAKYHVDLVRASVDEYGLGHEQRLNVGQHNSWMEAEEQLYELEDGLAENGLAAWGENAERLREQPFEEDIFYMAVTYPPDSREGDSPAVAHLLAIGEHSVRSAKLVTGDRESVERMVDQLDLLQAEEGTDPMLEGAQLESEINADGTPTTSLFDPDDGAVRHVDGGGTTHWFAVVEQTEPEGDPYELRYFRELNMEDGIQHQDSYPVMPLPDDDPSSAWALPGLEMYLQKGDVFMAQQFAHDVANAYGQEFPEPMDLPSLDPRPEYYFGYGVSDNNEPSLEAVKTWMQGAERRFDTLTVGEYGMYEEAAVDERELETLMDTEGVEAALNLAETMAVAGGYLDPERDDSRIFFEDDAPPDAFTTNRERELAEPSYSIGAISANGESFLNVYKEWGVDDYERLVVPQPDWDAARDNAVLANEILDEDRLQDAMRLVEVAGIEAGSIDPEREDGRLFTQGPADPFQTIRQAELQEQDITVNDDFDTDELESSAQDNPTIYAEWAEEANLKRETNASLESTDWFEATFDNDALLEPLDSTVNYAVTLEASDPWTLELAVEKVWKGEHGYVGFESQTVQTYDPDEDREVAEAERDALLEVYDERGLEAMMHKAELQAMQNGYLDPHRANLGLFRDGPQDRFETLAQRLENETNPYWNTEGEVIDEPEPSAQNPYWRLDTIPVNDPEGEPLGHALHMVVYDNVEHDPECVGTPPMAEDEPFRMLEMAHFETTEAADKFGKEFNGYLMPGLLEGPELAVEVARLEELPVNWKTLEGDDLKAYQDGQYTIIHDLSGWHPYNPNAERDARIEAEGIYTDSMYDVTIFNNEDESQFNPSFPDPEL
ncbi:hypothetical protein G4Y79_18725 [Phototrophicus methaneseepsis]|uniref:Uncharacterized protein n=1 Tax=Phototrophicus methaneseepsis TaxID=2710758 RepID=A0A7S8IDM9_9CHLR|nr:hypothetical protein [Phototrophicus methaneseepsis]QPC81706.1 hypothetical protein G4Y79_18725 [Phototrophicus methaneseepsis]